MYTDETRIQRRFYLCYPCSSVAKKTHDIEPQILADQAELKKEVLIRSICVHLWPNFYRNLLTW
jgi:hypothetical protein